MFVTYVGRFWFYLRQYPPADSLKLVSITNSNSTLKQQKQHVQELNTQSTAQRFADNLHIKHGSVRAAHNSHIKAVRSAVTFDFVRQERANLGFDNVRRAIILHKISMSKLDRTFCLISISAWRVQIYENMQMVMDCVLKWVVKAITENGRFIQTGGYCKILLE